MIKTIKMIFVTPERVKVREIEQHKEDKEAA
jgi:hypothetical protein